MRHAWKLVAVLALATGSASADMKTTYGTAGCGLGSMLFGDQKGGIQILAATTNGTFGTQTFGITTGTSNCGEAAVGKTGAKTFIEGNREALAKDAARGSGETIDTLTVLAGCKDARDVGAVLQKRFPVLFPESTPVEKVSGAVLDTLKSEKSLACTTIG